MGRWAIERHGSQEILVHDCDRAAHDDTNKVLHQDIGGGYIRCDRCGEKYLPPEEPGNPRLLFCYKPDRKQDAPAR